MNVCRFKAPEYIEAFPNHFVACHLYNKEVMENLAAYDAEYERLEAERLARLEEERLKKEHGRRKTGSADDAADGAAGGEEKKETEIR